MMALPKYKSVDVSIVANGYIVRPVFNGKPTENRDDMYFAGDRIKLAELLEALLEVPPVEAAEIDAARKRREAHETATKAVMPGDTPENHDGRRQRGKAPFQ